MSEPMGGSVVAVKEGESKKTYPMIYLEWDKPYNLPDGEFTMTVRARKSRSTEDHKNDKYSEDVEILSIENVEGGKKAVKAKSNHDESGDALDKIKNEMYPEKE